MFGLHGFESINQRVLLGHETAVVSRQQTYRTFQKIHLSGENKQFFTRKSLLVLACSNMRSKYPNPTIPREVTTTSVDAIADNQTYYAVTNLVPHTHTDAGIRVSVDPLDV